MEYNYVAQEDDELTLRKGDIITGIKMMFGGWWEGTLRDKRGMFPDNFVKVFKRRIVPRDLSSVYIFIDSHTRKSLACRYWTPRPPAEVTAARP